MIERPFARGMAICLGHGHAVSAPQVIASNCSLLSSTGTIVSGAGRLPAILVIAVTSGPGPPLPEFAPSTRTPISLSASMWARICSSGTPSRITRVGSMSCLSRIHLAKTLKCASIRSRASARMMSPTPIQWLNSSGGMTERISTPPPVLWARMAAKRIAFRHSRVSSSTTRNLRIRFVPLPTPDNADCGRACLPAIKRWTPPNPSRARARVS
mmetsp:Transcript_1284/g.2571  ORF Transcript_1284/g.2571 Transcript_1284/m.2571 type:complete len:213 (-) Transcript_1284:1107-1745(-)